MNKAFEFINTVKISMSVIFIDTNFFLNKYNWMQMDLLNTNHPDSLFNTMVQHIKDDGGKIIMSSTIKEVGKFQQCSL